MKNANTPYIDDEILVRYLSKETSSEENKRVKEWIDLDEKNLNYFKELKLLWQASASGNNVEQIDTQTDWKKVQKRISAKPEVKQVLLPSRERSILGPWLKVAAAIILLVGSYIIWFSLNPSEQTEMITTITTDQITTIVLSDGSTVNLNRNSTLTYPEDFMGDNRTVELEGEAFFEVTEKPESPFIISSGNAVTRVLGTSFNVDARYAKKVAVSVYSGKVALADKNNPNVSVELTTGKQGMLSVTEGLISADNQDKNLLAWKTGILTFQNTPIADVIVDLEEYYQQPIKIGSEGLKNCRVTATYDQATLEEVLTELKLILPIDIEKSKNAIKITGLGCE